MNDDEAWDLSLWCKGPIYTSRHPLFPQPFFLFLTYLTTSLLWYLNLWIYIRNTAVQCSSQPPCGLLCMYMHANMCCGVHLCEVYVKTTFRDLFTGCGLKSAHSLQHLKYTKDQSILCFCVHTRAYVYSQMCSLLKYTPSETVREWDSSHVL